MFTYHYAVFKGRNPYFMPACVSAIEDLPDLYRSGQGLTIVRGHVNCEECKEMMGMV